MWCIPSTTATCCARSSPGDRPVIPLRLSEIAVVVGGHLDGDDALVTGPAFLDSRSPEPGGLFVAFVGERVDGHEHAGAAVGAGAAGVLGSRATGVPTVVVDDVQEALQALARAVLSRRRTSPAPLSVLAITGSQGKTSAKDMLAKVLADAAPTVATHGSFNNELGLPLTVLRVVESTRHLVLEMGARGVGHLAALCGIARPDVSLVLNVGLAHIGEFGSQEQIALAKGELVEALPDDGVAVLNADDPLVRAMASRTGARVTTFGAAAEADLRLGAVALDDLGRPSFDLSYDGATERVQLALLGEHHAGNAAAVAATAIATGLPLDAVAESLRGITTLSKWRMQLLERPDGLRVVNDAYNANPGSMRAALTTLAGIGRRSGARTVAVLGEMRELGASAPEEHRAVGRLVGELGIDVLVVVGPDATEIGEGAREWVTPLHVGDVHEAVTSLRETVRASDVVLVKASRGAALERVVEGLLAADDREEPER